MVIHVELLMEDREDEYEQMLLSRESSLLYASPAYRRFLKRVLGSSTDCYLAAYEAGYMVGALPAFIRTNTTYGNILNSLPFYGSNGGVSVHPGASNASSVKKALIQAFHSLAAERSAVASTIVSNPLDPDVDFYESSTNYTLRDERIGQITPLPRSSAGDADMRDSLMGTFHQKTRNCIRKAQKSSVVVYHSDSIEALKTLSDLHRVNIEALGGLPKGWEVFKAIREVFLYDRDYRVYMADLGGRTIAGLLVFFYNRTAEYYTPATDPSYRVYQPMSSLVFEAMCEAAQRGCTNWNWGGTWLTQDGVYRFKSRWGTRDLPYFYYIREYGEESALRRQSPETLLSEYPYFYALPFRFLEQPADPSAAADG